jgi:hypothetical protein
MTTGRINQVTSHFGMCVKYILRTVSRFQRVAATMGGGRSLLPHISNDVLFGNRQPVVYRMLMLPAALQL